jgi:hypothetical protein
MAEDVKKEEEDEAPVKAEEEQAPVKDEVAAE